MDFKRKKGAKKGERVSSLKDLVTVYQIYIALGLSSNIFI
jgi:hypothetical protein